MPDAAVTPGRLAGVRTDGKPVNHPANLPLALQGLAEIRGMPAAELAPILAQNWTALFSLHARIGR